MQLTIPFYPFIYEFSRVSVHYTAEFLQPENSLELKVGGKKPEIGGGCFVYVEFRILQAVRSALLCSNTLTVFVLPQACKQSRGHLSAVLSSSHKEQIHFSL